VQPHSAAIDPLALAAPDEDRHSGSGGFRRWLAPAFLAAWLVPLAAHAVGLEWLLPPLVLLITAALLRGGRTLFDRLILAVTLLLGVAMAAGLLFSIWPWRLHPVPVTGLALTALVVVSVATGRRPALPRPAWTDAVPLLVTAALIRYLATPYVGADLVRRVAVLGRGEDNFRHLALFDVVGRLGGYVFLDEPGARDHLLSQLVYYPQGWHLSAVLLDGFIVPASTVPGGTGAMDHYISWTLAGFGLLVAALLWAAQWLPGRVHPLHRMVLAVAVGSLLLGSQLPRLLGSGFPTETLGLTLTVVLAALVARPVAGPREQLVLLGALLVGIGFCYYLFLFPAGILVLGWLVARRKALSRVPRTLVLVTLPTAVLSPVVPLLGLLVAGQSEALTATSGPDITEARLALLGLGIPVVLGLVAAMVRRPDPAWRRHLLVALTGVGYALGVAGLTVAMGGRPAYYYNKAAHLAMALLIVGTVALVVQLPAPRRAADAGRARMLWSTAGAVLAAALATLTVVTVSGLSGLPGHSLLLKGNTSWAQRFASPHLGGGWPRLAQNCVEAYHRYPPVPGTTTLVVDRTAYQGYLQSLCLSALQGTTAQTEPGIYGLEFREPDRTAALLHRVPGPLRIVVADPAAGRRIDAMLHLEPTLRSRLTTVTVSKSFVESPP
jgi:hypothetical protein